MITESRKATELPGIHTTLQLAVVTLCLVILGSGCQQQRRVNWNPLNWKSLERLPPPPTGSLNIPGVNRAYPTSALPSPPLNLPASQLPNASGNVGPPNGVVNPLAPGVYFPNNSQPATNQSQPWQSTTGGGPTQPYVNPASSNQLQGSGGPGNSAAGTYSTIPGREGSNPGGLINPNLTAGAATSGASSFNMAAVPALNFGGFDPFATSSIPNWNNTGGPAVANEVNPMLIRSAANAGNPNQPGWWPTEVASSSGSGNSAVPTSGIGRGQLLQRLANNTKAIFNRQPANLGGFQTTAPIENPMILATNYNAAPVTYLAGQASAPGQFPGPLQANTQAANPSFSRVLDAQAQQAQFAAVQRQMQAIAYQNALAARARGGSGAMQVLAENTTSEIAENQNRLGMRAPVNNAVDPKYLGMQTPQGSAQATRAPMLRTASVGQGMISATDQSGVNSSWQSTGVR